MELSKFYQPKEVEDKIYLFWQRKGFFNPDKLPKRYYRLKAKPFVTVIPPPNITGELHMGHALNTVCQDILVRQKRMQGYQALWVPGTDHAGIATQNAVEKKLKKQGITRFDLGREKFIEQIWEWKKKYGDIILNQLKRLGASCDWSRTRFTMDKGYYISVVTAFQYYFEKGWIYRKKRAVNWCPRCQTSLSDLELEYKEEKGKLWYIKYPIEGQKFITVATTRPETMLGDTAVAVNPKDKRYKHLIGKTAILPLVNRKIPIIADRLVDPKFGTGAVKITPAHDLTDYEIGLSHNLEIIQVIDKQGRITDNVPSAYQNLLVLAAREKIVKDLREGGFLEKTEDYIHQVPRCYRCQTVIEIIPSWQWFLKMKDLAELAEKQVKTEKIKFYPKRWEKIYFDWLKNIKDWCISRQIWWGHRLPIWHCQIGKLKSNVKSQKSKVINKENYFVSIKKPKKCPICGKCKPKQAEDVLDTWFSSALWPFAVFNWPRACVKKAQNPKLKTQNCCNPKKRSDLERFYPTDVLVTDRGIINLWVARMVFSGMEFMRKIPFKKVYIHSTVLTKQGKRMSKSLGTGINPIELIEKYGSDATRFGIAWQIRKGQDIRFTEDNIVMGKKFCNKLWNATRFVLGQLSNLKLKPKTSRFNLKSRNLTQADKRILKALNKTIESVNKNLDEFQFGKAAQELYKFFWHDFCDKYIEQSKSKIQNPKSKLEKEQTQQVLFYVLLTSLKLLHPFIPFITEEIYQKLPLKDKKKCLMVEEWPVRK